MIYDERGVEVTPEDASFAATVVTLGMASGKHNTINLAKRCIDQKIEGDFVECGVNAGGHPALMAYVIRRYDGGARHVHLYDSFQGMPVASPDDSDWDRSILGTNPDRKHGKATGHCVAYRWQVEHNMGLWVKNPEVLVYHEGWFQDVLPAETTTPAKIALLRIDCDLYDSTTPVLEYLYPRVPVGGYIISDDWGESEAPIPARLATLKYFESKGLPTPTVMRIPHTPGTVWFRKP